MILPSRLINLFLKRNLWPPRERLGLRLLRHLKEDRLVEFPGAVGVGIGESRFVGRTQDAELPERRLAAGQSQANLAQRVQVSELTEQHGHELLPAGEAPGAALGPVLRDGLVELATGNHL